MVLNDIALLAIPNARSLAYLSELLRREYHPAFVLLLENPSGLRTPGQREKENEEQLRARLDLHRIPYQIISSIDINSAEVVGAVRARPEAYVVYSGPGGALLKHDLIGTGKRFLHVHPGRVPDFRGSTTIYYHLLLENGCAASAIFLDHNIDQGPLLRIKEFGPPHDEDLDYEYDPRVRAELLGEVIDRYVKEGVFREQPQPPGRGETYFIMHPVLRHLVRLKEEQHGTEG